MSTGTPLEIGEVSGERILIALGPDRVTTECLRCGAIEHPHRNMFRAKPGPCAKCRMDARKARTVAKILEEFPEVDGCLAISATLTHVALRCVCGSEYTLRVDTLRCGQHHTPHRCMACRKVRYKESQKRKPIK